MPSAYGLRSARRSPLATVARQCASAGAGSGRVTERRPRCHRATLGHAAALASPRDRRRRADDDRGMAVAGGDRDRRAGQRLRPPVLWRLPGRAQHRRQRRALLLSTLRRATATSTIPALLAVFTGRTVLSSLRRVKTSTSPRSSLPVAGPGTPLYEPSDRLPRLPGPDLYDPQHQSSGTSVFVSLTANSSTSPADQDRRADRDSALGRRQSRVGQPGGEHHRQVGSRLPGRPARGRDPHDQRRVLRLGLPPMALISSPR